MNFWMVSGTIALLGSALTLVAAPAAFAAHPRPAGNEHAATSKKAPHTAGIRRLADRRAAGHVNPGNHTEKRTIAHMVAIRRTVIFHDVVHHLVARTGREALLHHAFAYRSLAKSRFAKNAKQRFYAHDYGGISCVPFARAASGIELKGNAANWWDAASGVYQRGYAPEVGSILNFRSTGRMRLGHVAVVTEVLNSREVEVDHANWGGSRGGITRGVPIEDVSPANDWSEVRVALGHAGEFGSVYPTFGFIYDRPDRGTLVARAGAAGSEFDEVAEAPAATERHARYIDAPNHSLR
jgi:hypothetical protein